MKKIFWTCVGWLTIPGLMHMVGEHVPAGTVKPELSLRDIWFELGLTLVVLFIYGAIAIYFAHPTFLNTIARPIPSLIAIVLAPNLVFTIMCAIGIVVVDRPSTPDKTEA